MSLYHRYYNLHWSSALAQCKVDQWKIIVLSDECHFGSKDDRKAFCIWRTTEEANNTNFFTNVTLLKINAVVLWSTGVMTEVIIVFSNTDINLIMT